MSKTAIQQETAPSPPNFRVRAFQEGDYPAVLEIWQASETRPHTPEQLQRLLISGGGVLVAEAPDESVVGVLLWAHNGQRAMIWRVAVLPTGRGRGIASLLLEQAEQDIRATGLVGMDLLVREDNQPAKALYAKRGWQPAPTIEYWGVRFTEGSPDKACPP